MLKKRIKYSISLLLSVCILLSVSYKSSIGQETNNWEYNVSQTEKNYTVDNIPKKVLKEITKHIKGFQYIPGGTFIMGESDNFDQFSDSDSTLLLYNTPRRVTVPSFYICDHEVTNAEYREFVNWVRDSIARELLADAGYENYRNNETGKILRDLKIDWNSEKEEYRESLSPLYISSEELYYRKKEFDNTKLVYTLNTSNEGKNSISVYPDTLVWIRDNKAYSYNESLSKMYFWHSSYDNFPVVGISWEQAEAYCIWKTNQIKEALLNSKNNDNVFPEIILPTEAQWEYASLSIIEQNTTEAGEINQNIYPWNQSGLQDSRGNYLANFGPITDQNGFKIKSFSENKTELKNKESDYLFTTPIKSFPANNFKLYDMGGNVAEWVFDYASSIYSNDYEILGMDSLIVNVNDDLQTAFDKIATRNSSLNSAGPDITNKFYVERLMLQAKKEMHDAKVLDAIKNGRIVKGGSWISRPRNLQCSGREVFSQNKQSAFIGFRIAMKIPTADE